MISTVIKLYLEAAHKYIAKVQQVHATVLYLQCTLPEHCIIISFFVFSQPSIQGHWITADNLLAKQLLAAVL